MSKQSALCDYLESWRYWLNTSSEVRGILRTAGASKPLIHFAAFEFFWFVDRVQTADTREVAFVVTPQVFSGAAVHAATGFDGVERSRIF